MDATAGLPLIQLPPPIASVSVADWPAQIADGPMIAGGRGFTVNIFTAAQPVVNE
jgi:hypothetical protein